MTKSRHSLVSLLFLPLLPDSPFLFRLVLLHLLAPLPLLSLLSLCFAIASFGLGLNVRLHTSKVNFKKIPAMNDIVYNLRYIKLTKQ